MQKHRSLRLLALLKLSFIVAPMPAYPQGEWRCDCTTIVDSCAATVSVTENSVEVRAEQAQCARVDYFIDGLPFVTLVVDGQTTENWISRAANPEVIVQSCQVCVDNAGRPFAARQSDTRASEPQADAPALTPIVRTQPEYPLVAQQRGIEGSVTVEFTVTPDGTVINPQVQTATPAGIFDLASLSAVSRWRYSADADREPTTVVETLTYSIGDFIWDSRPMQTAADETMPIGPNQCVREAEAYEFADMVEVRLVSACEEPLLLFTCAVGVGVYANRWVCSSSEAQQTLLLPTGHSTLGATTTLQGRFAAAPYTHTDAYFVARAPNSETWWIACMPGNDRCRDDARQWTRSMTGQSASLDPQSRSQVNIARSF